MGSSLGIGDNADLWNLLAALVSQRPAGPVQSAMARAHNAERDIPRGWVTEEDKWGNDGAGALAGLVADFPALPWGLVRAAPKNSKTAIACQKMFLDILGVRVRQEAAEACARVSGVYAPGVRRTQCGLLVEGPSGPWLRLEQ